MKILPCIRQFFTRSISFLRKSATKLQSLTPFRGKKFNKACLEEVILANNRGREEREERSDPDHGAILARDLNPLCLDLHRSIVSTFDTCKSKILPISIQRISLTLQFRGLRISKVFTFFIRWHAFSLDSSAPLFKYPLQGL